MMKKWTAALLACMMLCMCASGAMAASKCSKTKMPGYKSVFYEGFDNISISDTTTVAPLPDGWDMYNNDADFDDPELSEIDRGWYFSMWDPCDGLYMMLSDSYVDGEDWGEDWGQAMDPDHWLYLPKMTIGENWVLSLRAADIATECYDHFGVFIDTGNDDAMELASWTLSSTNWKTFKVDLSEYAGQEARLAIRHYNSDNEYAVMLDCVHIWEPDPNAVNAVPSTGDDSNIALWIGLMAISFLGAAALSRKAKKAC